MLLWVIVPSVIFHNLPLDVIEGLAWGHGWPIGTYKHPPLQAWVLEGAAVIGRHHDAAIYATGAGCLLLTYWALWRLGRLLLADVSALSGVVALASCYYFATTIPEFNPNVVQMPLFALCGWLFWRGLQQDRWQDWVGFGLCAGLGMLGKYAFAVLLLSIASFMLLDPPARQLWRRPGPYLAVLVGTLLFIPHLIWLWQSHWLPFDYALSRVVPVHGWWPHWLQIQNFIGAQAVAIAPVLAILWLARTKTLPEHSPLQRRIRRYLTCLAWLPAMYMVAMGVGVGGLGHEMWGMALWPFVGLWGAERWRSNLSGQRWGQGLLAIALIGMPVALMIGSLCSVTLGFRAWRTEFPGPELAQAGMLFWHAQNGPQPLPLVLGDSWFGGTMAWYSPDRPQLMIDGNTQLSPWVRPTEVAQKGALVVWDPDGGGEKTPPWALELGAVTAMQTVTLRYAAKDIRVRFALIKASVPKDD